MDEILWVAIAGFSASMVDGALGMGFGATSSSLLLAAGLPPASVSATVNLAKVASGAAAGISHWRFGNIDRRLVLRLTVGGTLGALIGVGLLSRVNGATLKPILAGLLMFVGLRILLKFSRPLASSNGASDAGAQQVPGVHLAAVAGGVTNGLIGAWGPVVTPYLLHRGVSPRITVGSVNTAEVAVAATSAVTLIASLQGGGGLNLALIAAMLVAGVAGAPLAAWVVRFIPPRPMGVAVAGLLLLTNARELVSFAGLGSVQWLVYSTLGALVVLAGFGPQLRAGLVARGATP